MMSSNDLGYREELNVLLKKWDELEINETGKAPKLSYYYLQKKLEDIKISRIWRHGTYKYVLEAANALLKRWQYSTPKEMSTFTKDVKELVDKQKSDVRRAFLGIDSPCVVRQGYLLHTDSPLHLFEDNPGMREFNEKVVVDPGMYKEVYQPTTSINVIS